MKRIILLSLFVFAAGCGGTNIVVKEFDSAHLLNFHDLQKMDNIAEIRNNAVYLDKGDSFPLGLNIDDDIIGVKQKSIDIVLKEKLYFMLKLPENPSKEELAKLENIEKYLASMSKSELMEFFERYMLFVSRDAKHWAPIYDGKALKEVLGIKQGHFTFGFGMDRKQGVISILSARTEK
jgi:hypothetical protein